MSSPTRKEYAIVLAIAQRKMQKYPEWRAGQAVFNVLHEEYPHAAESIRGGYLDMYHDDSNIDRFRNSIEN